MQYVLLNHSQNELFAKFTVANSISDEKRLAIMIRLQSRLDVAERVWFLKMHMVK